VQSLSLTADEDRFFAESFAAAAALKLDQFSADEYREMAAAKGYAAEELADYEGVPKTRTDFSKMLRAAEPAWCVTPQTRDIMDVLLTPSNPAGLRMSLLYRAYPS